MNEVDVQIEPQARAVMGLRWQLNQFDYANYPPYPDELVGKGKKSEGKIVDTDYFPRVIRDMFPNLAMGTGSLLYDWKHGGWYAVLKDDDPRDLVSMALQAAEDQARVDRKGGPAWRRGESKKDMEVWWLHDMRASPNLRKRVLDRLRMQLNYNRLDEKPPIDKVNLLNGVYHVVTGELEPHTDKPKLMSPLQIQFNYNPNAECPTWDRFFKESLDPDVYEAGVMWQILGWLLVPYTKLRKAVLLYGPTASGKSTFLAQIDVLFGKALQDKRLVSHIPLQTLSREGAYERAELVDKLVNVCGDLPDTMVEDVGMFKQLTGNDPFISTRPIYGHPFEFAPYARLLFSKNPPMLRAKDAGAEWFNRWLTIPFPNQLPEDKWDLDLPEKLSAELEGALVQALKGLTGMLATGDRPAITVTESMKRAKLEMEMAEPDAYLVNLMRKHYVCKPDGLVLTADVAAFLDGAQGEQTVDKVKAGRLINVVFPSATKTKGRAEKGETAPRGYRGIAARSDTEDI